MHCLGFLFYDKKGLKRHKGASGFILSAAAPSREIYLTIKTFLLKYFLYIK